ncbi:hypothetical protein B0H15DRAFT_800429 [Mycena belliarum]|uniref:Uncharacterized protein n=1 Tax=Mycena belliarum TaxID=1033014 RepID=A0AAD6U9F6_9AGAR|nr:hypothetical protein B0H15DRAFT_800429 [Mycena belliae]
MFSCRPSPPPSSTVKPRAHRVPRGLWKGRVTSKHGLALDENRDRPAKRPRYQRSDDTSDNDDTDDDDYFILDCDDQSACSDMDTAPPPTEIDPAKVDDWEDLKELFARAAEQYDCDNVSEALPLLRGVIHECHRFLLLYEDPSVMWGDLARPRSKSPEPIAISPSTSKPKKKCKCRESPTAFHALLGTALFLFGNLIAQDAALALPDEPSTPATYWLAALDVFETGENLPSRTSGRGCEAPEDWRMAIVWGRTLLCLADEALSLARDRDPAAPPPPHESDPVYPNPAASPFAAIAMRRPPASRRIRLASAVPHDLLLLAMDQFTRGIFHMPHAHPSSAAAVLSDPAAAPSFSRAKELFAIAREVLALAERLPVAGERQRWAAWADGVLQQMDMEGDTTRDAWRGPVTRTRGRCWLVVGSARVEEIEARAEERGWDAAAAEGGVLDDEEAEEAREGLARAVEFFERAMGSAKGEFADEAEGGAGASGEEAEELRAFLAEALLTLANLTKEEDKREELYARAEALGGGNLEGMDVDEDEDEEDE